MGRAPCCDKANVKKGPWSPEEDMKLKEFIEKYGTGGNWIALPQKAGLKRCGKSCRLRWLNYLRPNIKHGEFSDEEDRVIFTLFATIGSRWSIIASHLPGRTDNDIKNYWNTKLKKKLLGFAPTTQRKPNQESFRPPPSSSFPPSSLLAPPLMKIKSSDHLPAEYYYNLMNFTGNDPNNIITFGNQQISYCSGGPAARSSGEFNSYGGYFYGGSATDQFAGAGGDSGGGATAMAPIIRYNYEDQIKFISCSSGCNDNIQYTNLY